MNKDKIDYVITRLIRRIGEKSSFYREQYKHAKVISIEENSAGFFVDFSCEHAPNLDLYKDDNMTVGGLYGNTKETKSAVGFILFIRNGRISCLEGYTNGVDSWPSDNQMELVEEPL